MVCGNPPRIALRTPSPYGLTVAAGALVWATGSTSSMGGGTGSVETVSTAGGTPTTLAALSNPSSACGTSSGSAGALFALDSTNVYYFTGNSLVSQPIGTGSVTCSDVSACCPFLGGLPPLPDGGTDQQMCDTIVAAGDAGACSAALAMAQAKSFCISIGPGSGTPTQLASTGANGCVDSLVLNGGTLYYETGLSSGNPSITFDSVPTGGGSPNPIASQQQSQNGGGGSFVLSGSSLYFPTCLPDYGNCGVLGSVPVTGGSVSYSASDGGSDNSGSGQGIAVADTQNVYTVVGTWNCPNNFNNGNQDAGLDAGFFALTGGTTVTAFPLQGGSPTVLATTHDGSPVTGAAVDSSNIYWVTSTTAWSVPLGGGTATPIAGNLWAGVATDDGGSPTSAPPPCSVNGSGASNPTSIAADGTNVYIASPANGAIYKIPR
jgi:hypothetical protein